MKDVLWFVLGTVALIIGVCWLVVIASDANARDFATACHALQGTPAHDGRQWVCLKP